MSGSTITFNIHITKRERKKKYSQLLEHKSACGWRTKPRKESNGVGEKILNYTIVWIISKGSGKQTYWDPYETLYIQFPVCNLHLSTVFKNPSETVFAPSPHFLKIVMIKTFSRPRCPLCSRRKWRRNGEVSPLIWRRLRLVTKTVCSSPTAAVPVSWHIPTPWPS